MSGFRGMPGETVDGFGRGLAGLFLERMAFYDEAPVDAGKVELVVATGAGPERALFNAAMGQGGGRAEVGLIAVLEQHADRGAERGLVGFDGEDSVGVTRERVGG